MEQKEINEQNRLIAEFMGLTPVKCFGRYSISLNHCTCNEDTAEKALNGFASIAKYSTDWNWLMPVVKKICKVGNMEMLDHFAHTSIFSPIEAVYLDCLDAIKWYNTNKEATK